MSARLCSKSIFNFIRNCQPVFWSSDTILYSYHQWMSFCCSTFSPASGVFMFWILALGGSVVKNLPASEGDVGDTGLTPASGRFPGEKNGNPLKYSCLKNFMNRGIWRTTVHRVTKSQMWLSTKQVVDV